MEVVEVIGSRITLRKSFFNRVRKLVVTRGSYVKWRSYVRGECKVTEDLQNFYMEDCNVCMEDIDDHEKEKKYQKALKCGFGSKRKRLASTEDTFRRIIEEGSNLL